MRILSGSILVAALFAAGCFISAPAPQQPAGGGDPYGGGGDPYGGGGGGGDPYGGAAGASGASGASPGADGAPGPSGPTVVSVTFRSACPNTVRLFFGDKPKFGSGTYTTMSSNTVTSYSMAPGATVWIVDDSDNGVSSASVSGSTREIQVTSSCNGLSAR